MATSLTPVTAIPTTPGSIAGQFTAGAALIRLSVALTRPGADTLTLLQQQASGYWVATQYSVTVNRSPAGFVGAASSIDIPVNDTANYHVLSESGLAVAGGSVTLEDLTPSTGIALPSVSGDTIALLNTAQTMANKTLTAPIVSGGLTASGSAANDYSGSTGDFTLSTGALSWAGANSKAASLVATGAALTLTGGAASTWSTSSGALNLSGFAGLYLKVNGTTIADAGGTDANSLTLAAGKSLAGAAGAGALSFGAMTGATALPTGNLSWAGAATKTLSLAAAGAAAVTSSGGALTLTGGAASTWSTSSGALTVDSAAALNLGTTGATGVNIGHGSVSNVITGGGNALAVGANGSTNPVLKVDASAGSVATGLAVTGAAAASGVALQAISSGANESLTINAKGTGTLTLQSAVAVPAGGSAACGILASATADLGLYFGSGAPTLSAAKGSLYMRTDGSSASTRAYVNTDGATTWTNLTSAA